jgi:hypothetical protein
VRCLRLGCGRRRRNSATCFARGSSLSPPTDARSIARTVGAMPRTVSLWRGRFARDGLAGLTGKPRPSPTPKYGAENGRRILAVLDKPLSHHDLRPSRSICWARRKRHHVAQFCRNQRSGRARKSGRRRPMATCRRDLWRISRHFRGHACGWRVTPVVSRPLRNPCSCRHGCNCPR